MKHNINHKRNIAGSNCVVSRRDFIKITGGMTMLLGGGLCSGTISSAESSKNKPKNILLIITDQQHIDTISAAGCSNVKTPNMDRLVTEGMTFTLSYSTNPVCSPARSSILTGRTSCETGVYKNGKPIRSDIPNLGQWFSQHTDYETIYAGKWHVPRSYTHFIPGFKVINTGLGGAGYVCDPVVSRACAAYIQNRPASDPFMMITSFMQPHDICEWLRLNTDCPGKRKYPEVFEELPELPANFVFDTKEPEKIRETRQSREGIKGRWTPEHWRYYKWSYYRHIEMVDGEIGRLLQVLEDTGRLKDTLIVFTSDHGEGLGHHQLVRKSVLYDEAVRVPLIFSWPGRIKNKINSTELVSGLDILPTLCDYAGIKIPTGVKGKSLRKVLEGESSLDREYIVSEVSSNTGRMVRSKQYKYIKYLDDPVEQLFDMKNDPGETKNLAGNKKYALILKKHNQMLGKWEKGLDVASNVPEAKSWIAAKRPKTVTKMNKTMKSARVHTDKWPFYKKKKK